MPLLACSPPSDLWNFNNQSLDACAIVPYLNLTYFHGGMSKFLHPSVEDLVREEGLIKEPYGDLNVSRSLKQEGQEVMPWHLLTSHEYM